MNSVIKLLTLETQELIVIDSNFQRLDITEAIGLRLPIIQLTTLLTTDTLNKIHINQELILTLTTEDTQNSFKIELVDIYNKGLNKDYSNENSIFLVTLNLVAKRDYFVTTVQQTVVKDSIATVLKSLGFEVNKNLDNSKGKQLWINPNQSRKFMARHLITHLYLGEKDTPLSAITLNRNIVTSLKNVLELKPYEFTMDDTKDSVTVKLDSIETNNSLISTMYNPKAIQPVIDKRKNIVKYYNHQGKDITKGLTSSFKTNGSPILLEPLIDNGNCYKEYYQASIRNKSAWVSLEAEKITIKLHTDPTMRFDIEILNTINITNKAEDTKINGLWVVTAKYMTLIIKGGAITYLKLARVPKDFFGESS